MEQIDKSETRKFLSIKVANKSLFVLVLLTIFIVPAIPLSLHRFLYSILFACIILMGTQLISKNRNLFFINALIAIALAWIGELMDLEIVNGISKTFNVVLFIFIVLDLVKQVSRAKMVSPKVILESINGYLLIGMAFSVVVAFLTSVNPASYSFQAGTAQIGSSLHLCIYYAFITLTTVGYGDIIPVTAPARSLAVLISVTGQLYIAVVIAVLVGKYISQEGRSESGEK